MPSAFTPRPALTVEAGPLPNCPVCHGPADVITEQETDTGGCVLVWWTCGHPFDSVPLLSTSLPLEEKLRGVHRLIASEGA